MSEQRVLLLMLGAAALATALLTWRYEGARAVIDVPGRPAGQTAQARAQGVAAKLGGRDVMEVFRALEAMGLAAAKPRGPDSQPADSLVVRVTEGEQWMDFAGRDAAGGEMAVSVRLAIEGGAPSKVAVRFGNEAHELPLHGADRRANGGVLQYLAPQAGDAEYRFAHWMVAPDPQHPPTLARIKTSLPGVDPAFQPRLVRNFLDVLAAPERADDALGLYPALLQVERRGETLRAAGAREWLPPAQGFELVAQAYANDPVMRAAWAVAACESEFDTIGSNPACWQRIAAADPGVADLLRRELDALQAHYAGLDAAHPLRARLERWRRALTQG